MYVIVLIIYNIVNVYIVYIYIHTHTHAHTCMHRYTSFSLIIINVFVTSAFCLYTIHMIFTVD